MNNYELLDEKLNSEDCCVIVNGLSPDTIRVIVRYYFGVYEATFKKQHPRLRENQIERIIEALQFVDDIDGYRHYLDEVYSQDEIIALYKMWIDRHFQTDYANCNFSILHFISGMNRIHRLRECEV